jgi:hypothetical protein
MSNTSTLANTDHDHPGSSVNIGPTSINIGPATHNAG